MHRHNWVKIKETYVEPRTFESASISAYLAERILAGLTTILWECSICHKIRKEEMLGKEVLNGTDK